LPRIRRRRGGGRKSETCGFSVRFRAIEKAAPEPPPSSQRALAAASLTTVPPGSRLVGLVGEAPSTHLDDARSHLNYCRRRAGRHRPRPVEWAAGRYRGSPLVESTMPLRTTLAFLIAALWATSLLPAQAPDGDMQNILDTYRRLRPADKDLA